jgi:2-octaprenyl-6-methoxyphenol hydroxylase
LAYLQKFVAASSGDQKRTVGASDQIMKLFSSQDKSLTLGRQLGLLAMQNIPLAKTVFTRSAMGLDRPLANVLPVPKAAPLTKVGSAS